METLSSSLVSTPAVFRPSRLVETGLIPTAHGLITVRTLVINASHTDYGVSVIQRKYNLQKYK